MRPPVIATETGQVAASMLAGWGLDWADTIAAIEAEAIALSPRCGLDCDACRARSDDEVPVGTWFRLRWTNGRAGKWHRAGMMLPHLTQQFCRCGRGMVGYGQRRYAEIATETSPAMPPVVDRCSAWRKALR